MNSKLARPSNICVGLIGDYDSSVPAHQAIPLALKSAGQAIGVEAQFEWVPTAEIISTKRVSQFSGLWCVPASPYRSEDGASLAIRYARESRVPFLGTCGGFQHAVIEYARNVLGWANAEHAETAPQAQLQLVSPLKCELVEVRSPVRIVANSRLASAYGALEINEGYRCRFGLNPAFQGSLLNGLLRAAAFDAAGEVRAVELEGHPFFVATLFQPERAALRNEPAPLVQAFIEACCQCNADQ